MNDSHPCHIFAHRGANREATENTRAAFNKALNYPIDGLETDVQLSRDDIPVLWHDRYLDKLGYKNQHIDDFDYAELERMNFLQQTTETEGVLSLKEFLENYRGCCRLQIEIKNREWEPIYRHESKVKQCIDLIGDPRGQEIFISSFNLPSIIFAHHYAPDFPLYFALHEQHTHNDVEYYLNTLPFLRGMCMHVSLLDEAIVSLIRNHDKSIATYTCNTDEEITRALEFGVDILITDDPEKALLMRT